ncbi:hypothetical protein QJS04_geneDACA007944 [Acorus gramineus]|uniref:Phosphatidylinositol-3,4,5-trisphosphate 3-phosphatase n=1 Tax=Acorus gramineus TaxID=55184 RepID=A0AAV9BAX9_ACOGR|nr:hypothetical protein QJS04_geneDACA007944 [Acorus gramineus]
MSYITDHLLAMSFPAERMRAIYRNPLWQVKDVLDMRHSGHYKVYNLCAEESYDPSHFHGRVEVFPFDDNHVPSLFLIKCFCESVQSWLSYDPENVAVIHCMAGKGRTGLMVCAYLVYSGMSADEALQMYAHKRTVNNEGVSIPSQRRYVGYWSSILSYPCRTSDGPPDVNLPQQSRRELRRIRLYDVVDISSVFFVISEMQEVPCQLSCQPVEVIKSCCREAKQGHRRTSSPRFYLIDYDEEEIKGGAETPHFVMQMDIEISAIYQKKCLDYYFEQPCQVRLFIIVIGHSITLLFFLLFI